MKYIAIINSDEPLTEGMIQAIKDTVFCGDDQAPYVFEIEKVLSTLEAHGLAEEAKQMAIEALEQEPFMNKPCVAHQICHEDKVKVLDKIRAEIEEYNNNTWRPEGNSIGNAGWWACNKCIEIIDKYKAESEDKK